MSEQEKKSGVNAAGGSSVVMVEQSAGSRHKQPYRPTELQEEAPPDLHQKRSRAPAVPSVAEELKNISEDSNVSDTLSKDRKECERAKSSEKHTHVSKKTSSKRHGPITEEITLAPLEVEAKKGSLTPPAQPIPAQVETVPSAASLSPSGKEAQEKRADEDSITEEVGELRTPEMATKKHEWGAQGGSNKRRLDKKASLGPYVRTTGSGLRRESSGILLSIPKKSSNVSRPEQSGISIKISKKGLASKSEISKKQNGDIKKDELVDNAEGFEKFLINIRGKCDKLHCKIRNVLKM